jgi:cytochrome P450
MGRGREMTPASELYYDPYDFEIDLDPHPAWKRMRDEAPLYYNEKYDFYALSRFDDVEKGLLDWDTYRSGRGSILELIKANIDIPPGNILFEDPPIHDAHRALLSRVFTPKKMNATETKVREFCKRALDEHVGSAGFDLVLDLGAVMPMQTLGMLLGIPESDQASIRDSQAEHHLLRSGEAPSMHIDLLQTAVEMFDEYIEGRAQNPSDDLMTELLTIEFDDDLGVRRRLTRAENLTYLTLIAGAGNNTESRLIGWTAKLLAEHPAQRRDIARDRSLVPKAIEEILRYEAPSPIQARYVQRDVEVHGQTGAQGSVMVLLNGSANRDEPEAPEDHQMVLSCQITAIATQDLLFGPTLRKFPTLRVALSEGGIGWIPFYFDRIDRHFWNQDWLHDRDDFGGKQPSEVFRDHFLACFITDPSGLELRHRIGVDIIAWECDYPHSDTTWPESPEFSWKEFQAASCTEEEIHKITWQNTSRIFDFDPFKHTPQEEANVGFLRALAANVDMTRRPKQEWKRRNEATGVGVFA